MGEVLLILSIIFFSGYLMDCIALGSSKWLDDSLTRVTWGGNARQTHVAPNPSYGICCGPPFTLPAADIAAGPNMSEALFAQSHIFTRPPVHPTTVSQPKASEAA